MYKDELNFVINVKKFQIKPLTISRNFRKLRNVNIEEVLAFIFLQLYTYRIHGSFPRVKVDSSTI